MQGVKTRSNPPARRKPPAPGKHNIIRYPRAVAKIFRAYHTDPEILLACMIVSGTKNPAEVCRTELNLADNLSPSTSEEAYRYEAFRRVWKEPTAEEEAFVFQLARRIARDANKAFAWTKGGLRH